MKRVKFSLFALAAIFATSCVQDPIMEESEQTDVVVASKKIINTPEAAAQNSLILYVDDATADAWSENATRSGNANLDALASDLAVESVDQLFNMQINGAEKRAQGLHRWFVVKFSSETKISEVAEKFASISSVKRVQYNKVIERPDVEAIPAPEGIAVQTRAEEHPFNDEMLPLQWHYNNMGQSGIFAGAKAGEDIGAYGAWKYTTGNPEIVVAVVDEGIKYTHPDLVDNMWVNQAELNGAEGVDDDRNGYVDDIYGLNSVKLNGNITWNRGEWRTNEKGQREWNGDSGHGTHVAGTVAAVNNNGIGVAGVAGGDGSGNGVRLMSIQIFDGCDPSYVSNNVAGIVYAADNGACILQNSWGYPDGPTSDGAYSSGQTGAELDAFKYFMSKSNCPVMTGNAIIFAAGNDGVPSANYPGAYNEFLCVTAYAPDGVPTTYTNYDKGCNVAAPGGESGVLANKGFVDYGCVLSTLPSEVIDSYTGKEYGSDYGYMAGTSMACPHVSGVAALLLSYAYENGIHLTATQLYDILTSSVRNIDNILTGKVTRHGVYSDGRTYAYDFFLDQFKGKMGTGKLDATLAIMNLRGATCLPVVVGEECAFKIGNIIGTGDINVTMTRDFVIDNDVRDRLGIITDFFNNTIYMTCSKPGIGVATIKYIAGGNTVGGGAVTGGKLMEKEIVIISRENNDNGAWL